MLPAALQRTRPGCMTSVLVLGVFRLCEGDGDGDGDSYGGDDGGDHDGDDEDDDEMAKVMMMRMSMTTMMVAVMMITHQGSSEADRASTSKSMRLNSSKHPQHLQSRGPATILAVTVPTHAPRNPTHKKHALLLLVVQLMSRLRFLAFDFAVQLSKTRTRRLGKSVPATKQLEPLHLHFATLQIAEEKGFRYGCIPSHR
eukprot:3931710-Rhodomonas_salina.2